MARFLARRLIQGFAIVFMVATLTFVLIRLAPGDPFAAMAQASRAPEAFTEQAMRNWGLDRPLVEQYLLYLRNLARGEFGMSSSALRPVSHVIKSRLLPTVVLTTTALIFMFAAGIAIGVFQGVRRGSTTDDVLSISSLLLYSVPIFWLGIVLLYVFAELLHLFPTGGWTPTAAAFQQTPLLAQLANRAHHLALPAITLGLVGSAVIARYQRAAMIDVAGQDFVRAARARGLSEGRVILRHALGNALLPIVTLFGLFFPILVSGAVLIEFVFSWPGLGRLIVNAVGARDYNLVTGIAIITSAMVVLGNIIADILYWYVDPRTRPA